MWHCVGTSECAAASQGAAARLPQCLRQRAANDMGAEFLQQNLCSQNFCNQVHAALSRHIRVCCRKSAAAWLPQCLRQRADCDVVAEFLQQNFCSQNSCNHMHARAQPSVLLQ